MIKPPVFSLKYHEGKFPGDIQTPLIEVCARIEDGFVRWVFEWKIDRYYYNHKESLLRN